MKFNEDFLKVGKQIVELQKQMHKITKCEANRILENKITDDMQIQRALDGLLEFCNHKRIFLLYRKLCKYYHNLNPMVTAEYIKYYKEEYKSEN